MANDSLNDPISFLQVYIVATKVVAKQLYVKYSNNGENNTYITAALKSTVDLLEELQKKPHLLPTDEQLVTLLKYTSLIDVFLGATVSLYVLNVLNDDLYKNETPLELVKLKNKLTTTNFHSRYYRFLEYYDQFQKSIRGQVSDGYPTHNDRMLPEWDWESEVKNLRGIVLEILELIPAARDALRPSLSLSSSDKRMVISLTILFGSAAYMGSSWMKYSLDMRISTTALFATIPLVACLYKENHRHKKLLKELKEIITLENQLKENEKNLEKAEHFIRDRAMRNNVSIGNNL